MIDLIANFVKKNDELKKLEKNLIQARSELQFAQKKI